METGLRGKRALVTGGASGIGRAVALLLAGEGADVVVADLNAADATRAAGEGLDGTIHGIIADVSEERGVVDMVGRAADLLGGLDLYVNNAGAAWHEPVTRVSEASLAKTMATNFAASVFGCREAARRFIPRGGGAIVAIGSTAITSAQPRETAYRAAKAALKAHIETAAVELAPFNIRVNLVTPGATNTGFVGGDPDLRRGVTKEIPLRREAEPEEIARAVCFLLSDRLAGYITGAELVVDGGFRLRPVFHGGDDALRALNAPDGGSA